METRWLTRTALLLAITLLFQSLRLIFPIPPIASIFLIGSLVNASLLISAQMIGWHSALCIAILAPLVAYAQHMLPVPLFILPVALGNIGIVAVFLILLSRGWFIALISGAVSKALILYGSISWLLSSFVKLPPKTVSAMLFAMSWPQFVTAVVGGFLAHFIVMRLNVAKNNH